MKHDPDTEDIYELGEVAIIEHRWDNPMRVTRWLRAGGGIIQIPEEEWVDLCKLMSEYLIEYGYVRKKGWFS